MKGEHLLAAQTLAQRMQRRQRLELCGERAVPTEGEVRLDPLLGRRQTKLFESIDLDLRERLVGEVRQGVAAPERERAAKRLLRVLGTALGILAPALLEKALEAAAVYPLRLDLEHVSARARDEQRRRDEQLPQPRHLVVEAVLGRPGGSAAPQFFDQAVARDERVRVQEEQREQGALLCAANRNDSVTL